MPGLTRPQTPPKFLAAMDTMLPPTNGRSAVIASGFGPRNVANGSSNHKGIDFSYPGFDPAGAYRIYSPVSGVVEGIGPGYNTITIRDSSGYLHQFLHTDRVLVRPGQSVSPGTPIGTMGGKGPNGRYEFATHVHYQVKTPEQKLINPLSYWEGQRQLFVNIPRQENGLPVEGHPESDNVGAYELGAAEVEYHNQLSEGSAPTIASYRPRMAAVAPKSGAVGALLPNRKPGHEPWPRTMCVNTRFINGPTDEIEFNTRLNPQLDPESEEGAKLIGKLEGDVEIVRGPFWRR